MTLIQNGSTAYNWVINSGHFVNDDDAANGGFTIYSRMIFQILELLKIGQ